jgi:two-component sensor histidine kinase
MLRSKFSARLSRKPNRYDYLLALVFVLASLIARAAIEALSPGIAYYVIMLPAVVFAGVFCGTRPAVLAACAGGAAVAGLFVSHGLLNYSLNTTNLDTLVYIPACGAVIWSTAQLRRFAAETTQTRARLQETLDAHDTLAREADHRIKNSLQLVSAFLRLQVNRLSDGEAKSAIEAAITRVSAVADAHLALQAGRDLRTVECDQMMEDLCHRLALLNPAISLQCHANVGLWLDADLAIPLSLIASELVTNALKHAFAPGTEGVVSLTVTSESGTLRMIVADSGAGLPVSPMRTGLGSTVITSLARQIGATIVTRSFEGGGTTVTLTKKLASVTEVSDRPSQSLASNRR